MNGRRQLRHNGKAEEEEGGNNKRCDIIKNNRFSDTIRVKALEKGYTLNEYRICKWKKTADGSYTDQPGEALPVHSEEDVFRIIGMDYVDPHDRDL